MSAKATERCACGAEITLESRARHTADTDVRYGLKAWREEHPCPVRDGRAFKRTTTVRTPAAEQTMARPTDEVRREAQRQSSVSVQGES